MGVYQQALTEEFFMEYSAIINELKKGQLRSTYLFWGEERSLREEILTLLKQQLFGADGGDFGISILSGKEISPDRIIETADTAPFFSKRQLVLVDNWDGWRAGKQTGGNEEKTKFEDRRLIEYLARIPSFSCLVFTSDEKVDRRKKIYQAMEQCGAIVELAPLKGAALERWIAQQVKELGKDFAPDVLPFIISEVGTSDHVSLSMVEQELTKLVLYVGARREITRQDAQAVLTRTPESSVFTLIDAVGQRQTAKALQLWDDLRTSGQEPLKLLYLLARQIRLIWQAQQLLDTGYAMGQIAGKIGAHPYVAQRVVAQGKNFTHLQLRKALERIQAADWSVKSGCMDPETMMQTLIVDLCN
jgi:DNA polymerase III subunit delta